MHVAGRNSSLESSVHVQQGDFLLYALHNRFEEVLFQADILVSCIRLHLLDSLFSL